MLQQENDGINQETFINIRKLAALDIVFHGSRLILAEFAVGVVLCGVLGVISLFAFLRNSDHPVSLAIPAFVFTWIAINYVLMLLYAINIVKAGSAEREVAFELEHKDY